MLRMVIRVLIISVMNVHVCTVRPCDMTQHTTFVELLLFFTPVNHVSLTKSLTSTRRRACAQTYLQVCALPAISQIAAPPPLPSCSIERPEYSLYEGVMYN